MSFLASMFNPSQGAGFQAQGANQGQANNAYNQAQNALAQQQGIVGQTQAANGIGNQSNVFNQLQNIASGQGPNPAQAMLNQATGQNVANQAALAASQRGASANPALMARNAALAGTNAQQQAVGQGATMQANQALGALGQMGGLATSQAGQQIQATQGLNQAAQNEQSNLLNSIQGQNASNAQIAGINAQGQQQMGGGLLGGLGSALMLADGGEVTAPSSNGPSSFGGKFLQGYKSVDANAGMTPQQRVPAMQQAGTTLGSMLGKGLKAGFGAATGAPSPAGTNPILANDPNASSGAMPYSGNMTLNQANAAMAAGPGQSPAEMMSANNASMMGGPATMARGGKVPAMVSPGEIYLPPQKAKAVAQGKASPMEGKRIPGKAKVKGDSLKNDTVPAKLEEGGVVIPRSIMESPNAEGHAARFVAAVMSKSHLKK